MISSDARTTILIVDDHPLMRSGLRTLLESEDGLEVIGEASDGEEAIEQARELAPAIVVMDISMPKLNGIEATRRILADAPDTRVVALSIHSEKRFVTDMLQAGASGYVLKDSVPEELVQAIQAVVRGEEFLSTPILGTMISAYRNPEISTNHEIGDQDGIELSSPPPLPVLQTKLYRPKVPLDLLPRPALLRRLNEGKTRPLTLVSAPAGYGKSTLIASWLEQLDRPGSWLALDRDESDLRQFMTYFVEAVKRIFPEACAASLAATQKPELPSVAVLATRLANELDELDEPFWVVLDDFHRIRPSSDVIELLERVLRRPPLPLHLAILSRRDPALSLVQMRAQGKMTEIRLADLRFTAPEVESLLQSTLGFVPRKDVMKRLERQIEGWAAGLRLVSLASRQAEDPEEFLGGLEGNMQQTREYLVQEVIQKQSPEMRGWLLKSAILERFSASLCTAVFGPESQDAAKDSAEAGARFLEEARAANLFLVTLDSRGEWYRYHHLFRQILLRELRQEADLKELGELHERASEWFESQGLLGGAVRHALSSGHYVGAAKIVERHRHEWPQQESWSDIEQWIEQLPTEILSERPELLLAQARCYLEEHRLSELELLLGRIEEQIAGKKEYEPLSGELSLLRGGWQYWKGDGRSALETLNRAESDGVLQSTFAMELAFYRILAGQMTGDDVLALMEECQRASASALGHHQRIVAAEALVHLLAGHLEAAVRTARRSEKAPEAAGSGDPDPWGHYVCANARFQAGDAEQALSGFRYALESHERLPQRIVVDSLAGLALSYEALGRFEDADRALDRLTDLAAKTGRYELIEVADSCKARLALHRGDLDSAISWAQHRQTIAEPIHLFCWVELPALTRARTMIASGTPEHLEQAIDSLASLKEACDSTNNRYQTIQIELYRSLALARQGHRGESLEEFKQAFHRCREGGWVRPVAELASKVLDLIAGFEDSDGELAALRSQLTSLALPSAPPQPKAPAATSSPASSTDTGAFPVPQLPETEWAGEVAADQHGVDDLTGRELDVLELLAERLQNKEIAARLSISSHTVNDHLKNIYQKLQVSGRREAAKRALELGILRRRP